MFRDNEAPSLLSSISRRTFALGSIAAVSMPSFARERQDAAGASALPFANGERSLARFPQKRPLIVQTSRPPQLETPFAVFDEGVLTPNDAFFVRYHLSGLPTDVDIDTYRLNIGGHVEQALSLTITQLRADFQPVEIIAVNQCSGNGRGFSAPRVAGGQLGNGAMGNASWRGVSLGALLERAGVRRGAEHVTFNGLDQPSTSKIPDFVKSLDIEHALRGEVLLAYEMNGAPLPFLNGYPLRLVVPGYYGTYWIKHLNDIKVLDHVFDGYWMDKAYRIPDNDCACVAPGGKPEKTRPIGKLNIRSFITSHMDGDSVRAGRRIDLRGIAFDGGSGIAKVEISRDGGSHWLLARLGEDLGPYSFREWRTEVTLPAGSHRLRVSATSNAGETQPAGALWNPAGYSRNVVEEITLRAIA